MKGMSKVGDPNDIMASFCAKMYVEAQLIDIFGFDAMSRDLFCEESECIIPSTNIIILAAGTI